MAGIKSKTFFFNVNHSHEKLKQTLEKFDKEVEEFFKNKKAKNIKPQLSPTGYLQNMVLHYTYEEE